eukprot:353399-Lingulodinium_polyedra.AAC.1
MQDAQTKPPPLQLYAKSFVALAWLTGLTQTAYSTAGIWLSGMPHAAAAYTTVRIVLDLVDTMLGVIFLAAVQKCLELTERAFGTP